MTAQPFTTIDLADLAALTEWHLRRLYPERPFTRESHYHATELALVPLDEGTWHVSRSALRREVLEVRHA